MPYLPWKDEYSVGVERFDDQHRQIFACINDLAAAMSKSTEHSVLRNIFGELIDYSRVHFRDEELNLVAFDYPDYKAHKFEHYRLIKQVIDYALNYCSNPELGSEILEFLRHWILDHVLESDMKYKSLLENQDIIEWD
ncbi:bacteriohemerythrin [bacterium]|nr:bacteriohemerythrin [bacterium]